MLPAELPRVPLGFLQRHIQDIDGIAIYGIHAPDGTPLPITWRYKVAARHDYEFRGYTINGCEAVFKTWGELARAWPAYVVTREIRRGA